MTLLKIAAAAVLMAAAAATAVPAATIEVDGLDRTFEMYVPPTAPRPLPVVLVLHGGGGTAAQMRRYSEFDRVGKSEDAIIVYPQAVNGHWNDGRPEIAAFDSRTARIDDIAFLLAIVDTLTDRGLADPRRIYAAGLAGGGMMVLRLACNAPDRLGGAAVVAANQPVGFDCDPSRPLPIQFFHGTDDRFVPYDGGDILQWANVDRGRVLSADDTVATWLKADGCEGPPAVTPLAEESPRNRVAVDKITFEPCRGAPVEHFVSRGGGHAWPGANQSRAGDAILGPTSPDIDATREIWAFFKSLPPR